MFGKKKTKKVKENSNEEKVEIKKEKQKGLKDF